MDEFLRDIHTDIFKEWIYIQHYPKCKIHQHPKSDSVIVIETDYSYSEVTFNTLNIIELSVTNTFTNEIEFYLHFQMKTLKHAIKLFHEMMDCIAKLIQRPHTRILLSCSGGLTTSFFASKMNEASLLLNLNFEVSAIGFNDLYNIASDYDIILLAPQISYNYVKVKEILKDKIVLIIPPQTFAKYDVREMIELIHNAIENKKKLTTQQTKQISLKTPIHNHKKILVLSIFRNSLRVHISYRLYDENIRILLNNDIIKPFIHTQDILDAIDTCLLQYPDVEIIGLSTPGIINNGVLVSSSVEGLDNVDLNSLFSSRYQQKFVFDNDVNTAAAGYYASQNKYSSFVYLFQPANYLAGAGIIINGHLIKGNHHIAGEVQYLPMNLSDDRISLASSPEGAIELVAKTITSIVSVISPEAIILSCVMIPRVHELEIELAKYLPSQYIPRIIKVDDIQEYILLGQMILCNQSL